MKKRIKLLVVSVFAIFCLGACGSSNSDKAQDNLVGKWSLVEKNMVHNSEVYYIGKSFELFSDGTAISEAGYSEKWIAENGRLKIGSDVVNYKLSGKKLILTEDDGCNRTYEKQ